MQTIKQYCNFYRDTSVRLLSGFWQSITVGEGSDETPNLTTTRSSSFNYLRGVRWLLKKTREDDFFGYGRNFLSNVEEVKRSFSDPESFAVLAQSEDEAAMSGEVELVEMNRNPEYSDSDESDEESIASHSSVRSGL